MKTAVDRVGKGKQRDVNTRFTMLPLDMVDGELQQLRVTDARPMTRDMFAVYPSRRLLPARVRKLIDFMTPG